MQEESKKSLNQIKPTLKKVDWYGLKHELIYKKFEGDLTFINYMNIEDKVVAVYHAKNPNKEKGHKEYMLLHKSYAHNFDGDGQWFVSGMDKEEIEKHAIIDGVVCLKCSTAMISLTRHHFHKCGCENETMVDGGTSYLRRGGMSLKLVATAKINQLTDEVVIDADQQTR